MRREYVLSDRQFEEILKASKPTPVMYLPGGQPMFDSPQENANRAWKKLGLEIGFHWETVLPVSGDPRRFTAEEKPDVK